MAVRLLNSLREKTIPNVMLNEVLETSKDTEDEEVDSTADPVDEKCKYGCRSESNSHSSSEC